LTYIIYIRSTTIHYYSYKYNKTYTHKYAYTHDTSNGFSDFY